MSFTSSIMNHNAGSGLVSPVSDMSHYVNERLVSINAPTPTPTLPAGCLVQVGNGIELEAVRVVRIALNRAAAPRDSRFGQNERLGDSAIRRFGNS